MKINFKAASEVLKKNGSEPVMAAALFLTVALAAFGIVADVGFVNTILLSALPLLQGIATRFKVVPNAEHKALVQEALLTPVPEAEEEPAEAETVDA